MRVRLKGLNSRTKKLADGTTVTYFYAWKGGPRLRGELGSPEFIASYHAAVSSKKAGPEGVLLSIMLAYQDSTEFRSLAPRTRSDYVKHIKVIETKFGAFPLAGLTDKRTRGEFLAWRDKLALKSQRQADYTWTVLARILSWALNRGLVDANPCARGGRIYRGTRADKIWTDDDEATFLARAPAHLHLALHLALWTGQRQGDLLKLTWFAYDGVKIRLRQSKTGTRVVVPVGAPLRVALDAAMPPAGARACAILLTMDGTAWTGDGFRSSWGKAQAAAGIAGVTFNDMRGTAVTRLALAGATEPEIATLTGHSTRDVRSILDAHYLNRDPELAESAMRKLEARAVRKLPD